MCVGMRKNKELIGNMIILLAERYKPLYLTKLLKLLYLIDEESVKKTGAPITWLSYKAWQFGPVSEDVYSSKCLGYNKFSQYVDFISIEENKVLVSSVSKFDDSEFSELDMVIIEDSLCRYGQMTGSELIDITHAEGSLWDKSVKEAGVKFTKSNKTSDIELNFVDLLKDDNFKRTLYYSTLENIQFQATL